jgi:hypothetical protein
MANWDEKAMPGRCSLSHLDPNRDVILHKSRSIEIIRSESSYAAQCLRVEAIRVPTSCRGMRGDTGDKH